MVIIKLTEIETGDDMTFPMSPEEIVVSCDTRFQSYDIMNAGEIKLPAGEELTHFSWNCILPGEKRQKKDKDGNLIAPYLHVSHGDPKKIQEWFSYLRVNRIKCKLLVTETPINHDVYLESYTMNYSGGFGDYNCDISFVHAKELKVSTENSGTAETTKATIPAEQQRPAKQQENSYIVKKNDCLWDIAQSKLGSGSRYMEIAELNGISNPKLIQEGQTLLLPAL